MSLYEKYTAIIDEKKQEIDDCSDFIFDHPELCFKEFESAKCLKELLVKEGFQLQENLGGIETAFSGRFGEGHPVIGLLGEFDALSGLSQKSGCPTHKPLEGTVDGHGCGHNLLGAGTFATALAIKKYLEETKTSGTIIFYGCPAEEGGSGKTIMAGKGVFDELDMAMAWHPETSNHITNRNLLGNRQYHIIFDGKAAHAAGNPYNGRSALDALELMNVGVQFLREHMPRSASVHYAITDTGGISPNVVQAHAEAIYLIREKNNAGVKDLSERVIRIAEGAAMMTDTKVTVELEKACSNVIPNQTLQKFVYKTFSEIPCPVPTEEDKQFIRELLYKEKGKEDPRWENPIATTVNPYSDLKTAMASSDCGDVSWICPTVRFGFATWGKGTGSHDWQTVAQGKTEWAKNAMRYGAKVMAECIISILNQPEIIEEAKKEHKELIGDGYVCPINFE